MSGSYAKINYGVRPAKSIQRKMLVEALHRLDRYAALDSYQYVGFGSPFFVDFKLVHRNLGIRRMICIETEEADEERFRFNLPFSCVEMIMGESTNVLPNIDLSGPSILWLDYDYPLKEGVLADVGMFAEVAVPGSVLLVTLDVEPGDLADRSKRFYDTASGLVPAGLTDAMLGDTGIAAVTRDALGSAILGVLDDRNIGASPEDLVGARQFVFFTYADGHLMATVGWCFDNGRGDVLYRTELENLVFFRAEREPYAIEVPSLTVREIQHLEAQMPCADVGTLSAAAIPAEELARYASNYRWFPNFVDIEL